MQHLEIDQDTLEAVARHEAGHVVMRYLKGLKATAVYVCTDGSGYTAGGLERMWPWDALDITLAGWAAEYGLALDLPEVGEAVMRMVAMVEQREAPGGSPNLAELRRGKTVPNDYETAVHLITEHDLLGRCNTVGESVLQKLRSLAEYLNRHEELVEAITSALLERHELTAREVAALLREAAKRTRYSAEP